MGYVTGSEPYIYASYTVAGVVLVGLAIWSWTQLMTAKKRVKMLEAARKEDQG